jgi:hypothetical protein
MYNRLHFQRTLAYTEIDHRLSEKPKPKHLTRHSGSHLQSQLLRRQRSEDYSWRAAQTKS